MNSNAIRGLKAYLRLSAAGWRELLANAGETPEEIDLEDHHIPLEAGFAIFHAAANASGKPALGIEYAHAYTLGGTGPLGFAIVNARNIREALQTICRFIPMISSMQLCRYEEDRYGGSVVWQNAPGGSAPPLQFMTWGVAVVISRIAPALPSDWKPLAVELSGPPPAIRAPFDEAFGPNLSFQRDANRLKVQAEYLDCLMPAANPRMFELMTRLAEIERQRLGICGSAFEAEARAHLSNLLPQGLATASDLADALGLSPAQMRKKLKKHDLDYRSLIDDIRRQTARECIMEKDIPITEIAFRLGYSDCSLFTRACHKWFGQAPRDMRNRALPA